ncbi:hypothetical protein HYN49_10555 [Flavobacterium pallidum]|uniref:Uncharacterized protein n=1 Tax=Flavobacterium pallidum TaxID=2172098 RepID=A0A2S1SIS5_9FLAO|nr:hypothetical protein HYN49_10555 [Flavobacterium pallidum]
MNLYPPIRDGKGKTYFLSGKLFPKFLQTFFEHRLTVNQENFFANAGAKVTPFFSLANFL